MTYSSRRPLPSFGFGRVVSCCCSSIRSSAMMSRQMSTHSSQMYTVGPAISFLTSRWDLLQKLQRKTSPLFPFFDMSNWSFVWSAVKDFRPSVQPKSTEGWSRAFQPSRVVNTAQLIAFCDDLIHQAVFHGLVRLEDVVAVGVFIDLFQRLPRVVREDLIQPRLPPPGVPRVDCDLHRLAPKTRHPPLGPRAAASRPRQTT